MYTYTYTCKFHIHNYLYQPLFEIQLTFDQFKHLCVIFHCNNCNRPFHKIIGYFYNLYFIFQLTPYTCNFESTYIRRIFHTSAIHWKSNNQFWRLSLSLYLLFCRHMLRKFNIYYYLYYLLFEINLLNSSNTSALCYIATIATALSTKFLPLFNLSFRLSLINYIMSP